jgi:hypothetical protein
MDGRHGLVRFLEQATDSSWGDLIRRLGRAELASETVQDWTAITARLEGGGFTGHQDAIEGRWFSDEAKQVLALALTQSEVQAQWLPATLLSEDRSESRSYWMLHFPMPSETAHTDLSTYGPGGLIRITLDIGKVAGRIAFPSPAVGDRGFYVADSVMQRMLAADVSSACFTPAHTSH